MAKCFKCGRKGIFLKLSNGMCAECNAIELNRKEVEALDAHRVSIQSEPVDDLSSDETSLLSRISSMNARGEDITPELYQKLRDFEMAWLERHYDFNTLEGVTAIPVVKDLPPAPAPKSPMKGHTGEVYYYLRHKAYVHEDNGNIELALACMRKSVALVKCRSIYFIDDCYPLARMLARAGLIEEAYREKHIADKMFPALALSDEILQVEIKRGNEARDYAWLQANLPDKCPKSISGFRRMKTQNTKNYQALRQAAAKLGRDI